MKLTASKTSLLALVTLTSLSPLAGCRNDETPSPAHEKAQAPAPQPSPSGTPAADERTPPKNPVQQEMQLLVAALQGTVAAIGDNDLARIPHLIHGTHGAKDATESAIDSGNYRLPQNADQVATFKGMDDAFHKELEVLVQHARANDLAATSTQVGRLLGQCQGCHALFREMPPPHSASEEPHAHP